MIQEVLVILILLAVSFFILRKLFLMFKNKDKTCACENGKCTSCSCCSEINNNKIEI